MFQGGSECNKKRTDYNATSVAENYILIQNQISEKTYFLKMYFPFKIVDRSQPPIPPYSSIIISSKFIFQTVLPWLSSYFTPSNYPFFYQGGKVTWQSR